MARRKGQQVNHAEARPRAAPTERMEAPVGDKEDSKAAWQRQEAFLRQKVRLKDNGAEMELGMVENILGTLEYLQEEKPKRFQTLLALVKPRRATGLPAKVSARAVEDLKKSVVLGLGDVPDERMAAVLDAAYIEKDGGGVLRDPVVYPSRQFAEEREALDKEANYWTARSPRLKRDLLKDEEPDKGGGASLG